MILCVDDFGRARVMIACGLLCFAAGALWVHEGVSGKNPGFAELCICMLVNDSV